MSGTRQPSENGHSGDTSADAASAPDTLPPARRSLLHELVGPVDVIGLLLGAGSRGLLRRARGG
jgi:hypothetical protein